MYRLIAKLVPGSKWKHTRSNTFYTVLHVGRIEASQELAVVYQHVADTDIWVRSVSSWFEFIDNGPKMRFEWWSAP